MNTAEERHDIESPKDAVREVFKEFGGEKLVAHALGIGHTRVNNFTKDHLDDEISYARIWTLTSEMVTAAAKQLCRKAGGVFCAVPKAKNGEPLKLLAKAIREHSEAVAAMADSLGDGKLSPPEAEAARKEIHEAMCALGALDGLCVQVLGGQP